MYYEDDLRAHGADWISTPEAVEMVRVRLGGLAQNAWDFLIRRAAGDLVLTKCRLMRCKRTSGRTPSTERKDALISFEFWEQLNPRTSVAHWSSGDFERTREDRWGDRDIVSAIGVEFSRRDLLAELPSPALHQATSTARSETSKPPINRSNAGKRPDKKAWAEFSAALAVVAFHETLGEEPSAAAIYEKVAQVLQARLGTEAPYFEIDNVRDAITLAMEWSRKGMPTN